MDGMTETATKLEWWEHVREIKDIDIELGAFAYRWDVLIDGSQLVWISTDYSKRVEALSEFQKGITHDSVIARVPLPEGATSARYLTKAEGPNESRQ